MVGYICFIIFQYHYLNIKILKFYENFFENFINLNFFENFEIFRKFWNFLKILKFSENFEFFLEI
jgi:hypothetical protein